MTKRAPATPETPPTAEPDSGRKSVTFSLTKKTSERVARVKDWESRSASKSLSLTGRG